MSMGMSVLLEWVDKNAKTPDNLKLRCAEKVADGVAWGASIDARIFLSRPALHLLPPLHNLRDHAQTVFTPSQDHLPLEPYWAPLHLR
jgi:hypothetical protein